jgi:glucokinase
VAAACLETARELATLGEAKVVGLGLPEIVSPEGEITSSANWELDAAELRRRLGEVAPVHIESDVRAAALAEARWGAGAGLVRFVYLSVGTNLAAVLVVDGIPHPGRTGAALVLGAPPVEELAGGAALSAGGHHPDALQTLEDPSCAGLVAAAATALGDEMARVVNLLDPAAVVVGGSLGLHPGYRRQWVEQMRKAVWHPPAAEVPVLVAGLGAEAGMVGAALAAWERKAR